MVGWFHGFSRRDLMVFFEKKSTDLLLFEQKKAARRHVRNDGLLSHSDACF
jgi:hypothetical protein